MRLADVLTLPRVAAALSAALLAGCSSGGSPTPAPTVVGSSRAVTLLVTGSVVLVPGKYRPMGDACTGDGAYAAVNNDAQVTVVDGGGRTLAVGVLKSPPVLGPASCTWAFEVAGVPAGRGLYRVQVAGLGSAQFPEDKLTMGNVEVAL